MQRLTICLWYDQDAVEATKLYTTAFEDSKLGNTARYGSSGSEVSGMPEGSVMTVDFEIGGQSVVALNGGPLFPHTPACSLFVTCGTKEEVDALHAKLSPGGKTLMELGEYPFSPRYAFFADRFGVHWQLILEKGAQQKVMPCLIFGGDKQGKGPEALEFYRSLFHDSQILMHDRYKKGEGGIEGSIKHARLKLDGSPLVIMDAGNASPMKMNESFSLTINCETQAEVDAYWSAIGKKGKEVQCGWVTDEFGFSWQVVPVGMEKMFKAGDPKATERAMAAMLKMKKLNIHELEAAYRGN